eukprot:jgi/Chrzof1/3947/Cz13g14150.t1
MGGMIALTLATRNGSQLSSVIALATTAGGPATILAPGYNPVATDSQQVDFRVLFPQGAADKGVCETVATFSSFQSLGGGVNQTKEGRRAQAEALSAYFFSSAVYSKLPQLSNKVMYLHGAVDVLLPVKGVYMAAARTPAADVIVLDGQGHGGVYQAPLQLSSVIVAFLQRAQPVSCPGVGEVLFGPQLSPPAPRTTWDSTHTVDPRRNELTGGRS